ncbi:MAG: class B sortase [Ruminococcus sp.]|nr:class B sortase [Ruminococcus sp.]MCD7801216.1 class B sortase [Ruminococcus sp.]
MQNRKKIVTDALLFTIIVIVMVAFIFFKNRMDTQPVTRMEAIGYSNTTTTESTTTEITTTTVTTVTTETETETTSETVATTLEPLVEYVADHSNISRASLPSAYSEKVANLKNDNSDTRGWISISNTNISYAFTQTTDNSFYLSHDFYGNESNSGWIFMDCYGTFDDNGQQSDLITLYGHNMANGSMFSTLKKYRDDSDFYEKNPIITLSSSNGYSYYKIYAYMICNGLEGSDFEFWKYSDLSDPNTFYYYVNKAFNKSLIITGVDVQYGDKLLTLSTCNTGSSTNHDRFVVLARMVRNGEDIYEGCYRVR